MKFDYPDRSDQKYPFGLTSNTGYNWLAFLHRFGLNGILADDMGLGKTLQTLAMIQKAKEQGTGKLPVADHLPHLGGEELAVRGEKFFS